MRAIKGICFYYGVMLSWLLLPPIPSFAVEYDDKTIEQAEKTFDTGFDYYQKGKWYSAIDLFQESYNKIPFSQTAYYISRSSFEMNNFRKAFEFADLAINGTPALEKDLKQNARKILEWAKEAKKKAEVVYSQKTSFSGKSDYGKEEGPPLILPPKPNLSKDTAEKNFPYYSKATIATMRAINLKKANNTKPTPVTTFLNLKKANNAKPIPVTTFLKQKNYNSDLIQAARDGNERRVNWLLNKGADINSKNERGETALMWAIKNEHLSIIKTLLKHGADFKLRSNKGDTALTLAQKKGYAAILELLERAYRDSAKMK